MNAQPEIWGPFIGLSGMPTRNGDGESNVRPRAILDEVMVTANREPRIRFFAPSQLRDFQPDNDVVLIGNCHVMRGEIFVIGGEPGVGKSLAATQLGRSGAIRCDWFGLPVHRQFRTLIVQTENGRYRLQQEFSALDCDEIESWIRVSEPPPFGLTLSNNEFQGTYAPHSGPSSRTA
jgi:hypothetical protein